MSFTESALRVLPYRIRELIRPDKFIWQRSWKTEIIKNLVDPHNGTFIDVGANLGQTLLDLYTVHPKASWLGFEPNAECSHYVRHLIATKALENHKLVPIALTDSELKILSLHINSLDSTDSSASLLAHLRPTYAKRHFNLQLVPCFPFDDIRASLNINRIGFVKIDVEGAELEVLMGMRANLAECRPLVLCEVLFTDSLADITVTKERNEVKSRIAAKGDGEDGDKH